MGEREQFTLTLVCPHCEAGGFIVWEENRHAEPYGPQRALIAVHGEFHPEDGRTNSGDPIIVCNICDEIQPD